MANKIKAKLSNYIDAEKWGKPLDPTDPNLTSSDINTYIVWAIENFDQFDDCDYTLFDQYKVFFEDFTDKVLQLSDKALLARLRDYLRLNGVYVPKSGRLIAVELHELLNQEEYPEWDKEQLRIMITKNTMNSRWDKRSPKWQIFNGRLAEGTNRETPESAQDEIKEGPTRTSIETTAPREAGPSDQNNRRHGIQPFRATFEPQTPSRQNHQRTWSTRPNIAPGSQPQGPRYFEQPGSAPNQSQISQTPGYQDNTWQLNPNEHITKAISNVGKCYNNNTSIQFGGEPYDFLNAKLPIFIDNCNKAALHPDNWNQAFSFMLKGKARDYFYDQLFGRDYDYRTLIVKVTERFHSPENQQTYLAEWQSMSLMDTIRAHPAKTRLQCLDTMIDRLTLLDRGLPDSYRTENALKDQLIKACQGIPECSLALYRPGDTFEKVCSELRTATGTAQRMVRAKEQYLTEQTDEENDRYWTDRTYGRNKNRFQKLARPNFARKRPDYRPQANRTKKCFICHKPGCWSTKHTPEERRQNYEQFRGRSGSSSQGYFQQFLLEFEGQDDGELEDDREEPDIDQLLTEFESDFLFENYSPKGEEESDCFFASALGSPANGANVVRILKDQASEHQRTRQDPINDATTYHTRPARYSSETFQGILPDSGASSISTAGFGQFQALQKIEDVALNIADEGLHKIRFGKGSATSMGTTQIRTPIGEVTFHVVPIQTPFLLCLADMDRLGVRLDNLTNELVQGQNRIPIVRKWGHPWLLLHSPDDTTAAHLTEPEIRQLHRRFGHPSVGKLTELLNRANPNDPVNKGVIKMITERCHSCQMTGSSPGRFRFRLKSDEDFIFNHEVITDVFYVQSRPVLHAIDSATSFQAARFLKDQTTKTTWNTLRECWIDTYLGPPDMIRHDAGKNFTSSEFRAKANSMGITVKEVPVEAHNSIGKVERYHAPLRRAFDIIWSECHTIMTADQTLQAAVKAVNDTAGPNGLVPTLLVFGAYPRLTEVSPPSPTIYQRAEAIKKAIRELKKINATSQVRLALATRNGPDTTPTTQLPLQSDVRVYREGDGWTGPYKLLDVAEETCTVDMPHGPTQFRSTVVKPYLEDPDSDPKVMPTDSDSDPRTTPTKSDAEPGAIPTNSDQIRISPVPAPVKRGRGRPRKNPVTFLTAKETQHRAESEKLRREGKITTPGAPFQESDDLEIRSLLDRGVFIFEEYNRTRHGDTRIFNARMVQEVKGLGTDKPYEKSRLVIQGYADSEKDLILTQSPTLQRASQRLILAIAPALMAEYGLEMWLRDVTQAYTQAQTCLTRPILARLPPQIKHLHPENTIMRVVKPLYGIAEAGTHWWATYSKHHRDQLGMVTSSFDPCLMITPNTSRTTFGVVGLQTDDTLILCDKYFAALESEQIRKANITVKEKAKLGEKTELTFNGCRIIKTATGIKMLQKEQGKKLLPVSSSGCDPKQAYVEQRARGAYIATISQPEALYDLSVAAQSQDPGKTEIDDLNKRLRWQMENQERGLKYVPFNIRNCSLYVFVDGSFANNRDLTSQLGFLITIGTETRTPTSFEMTGNVIHYSSVKSRRVTRSVLASEIYGMVSGVDMAHAIGTTLNQITSALGTPPIQIIVCTDSLSLYECLVKLGTTKEKRLMIDIMALRESYERREIYEIRWINGADNLADAFTKKGNNGSLKRFIDTNKANIRIDGWVERKDNGILEKAN